MQFYNAVNFHNTVNFLLEVDAVAISTHPLHVAKIQNFVGLWAELL